LPKQALTTRDSKAAFLNAIERGLTVAAAARHATVHRTTPYVWEIHDPQFKRDWSECRATRLTQLTDTAFDLAMAGDASLIRYLIDRWNRVVTEAIEAPTIRIIAPGEGPPGEHHDFFT